VQEARWPAFNVNTGTAKSGEKGGFRLFRTTETADRRPRASVLLCPLMTQSGHRTLMHSTYPRIEGGINRAQHDAVRQQHGNRQQSGLKTCPDPNGKRPKTDQWKEN
jgi:hypothetical protein